MAEVRDEWTATEFGDDVSHLNGFANVASLGASGVGSHDVDVGGSHCMPFALR